MKNKVLLIGAPLIIIAAFVGFLVFNAYHAPGDVTGAQFISPETLRQWISQDKALVVDVQTYDGYLRGHFPGSIPTHAYPVVTPDQKKRVEEIIPTIKRSKKPVVLVCFGGITGAPNARTHLVSKGVPNKRLFILQGGSTGWPWKGMLVSGNRR
jgi:thiosulfate/3-mercaptopyruvate sulfurtransferase